MHCSKCAAEFESFQLNTCPGCREKFCEPCGIRFQGMKFCGNNCAQIFFHGDIDDEDDLAREED